MLKLKLKKLTPFRKKQRRRSNAEMGNCAGSSTKEGRREEKSLRKVGGAADNKYTHGELVLKWVKYSDLQT